MIPTQKELEPLLEMDRDEKKLDVFLAYHKKTLTVANLKIFLPFTINLDPFIKKVQSDSLDDNKPETEPIRLTAILTRFNRVVCPNFGHTALTSSF